MATLPSYDVVWNVYPDYENYEPQEVKDLIGGAVNADWIKNTCAIRMSRALNYVGIPVPLHFKGMSTVKGGDSKRYAFRVREMRHWLDETLGKADFDVNKTGGDTFD